jgi:methyltransferase (TIGR00027 family)
MAASPADDASNDSQQTVALAPGHVDVGGAVALDRSAPPVALTSRWIAAARANESARPDRLFNDPFAAALSDGVGATSPYQPAPSALDAVTLRAIQAFGVPYLSIRTRFLDDLLLQAAADDVRQIVILAAGMDARAFRLPWPAGTTVYELDRPEVLAAKSATLAGAQPRCRWQTIGVDLAEAAWPDALTTAGFDPRQPSAWLVEGLLMYLDEATVRTLLGTIAMLAQPGSWLGADLMGVAMFQLPLLRPWLALFAAQNAPLRFGTDTPEALFAGAGWQATALQPGDEGANFGRWPFPVPAREIPRVPRSFLVAARRTTTDRAPSAGRRERRAAAPTGGTRRRRTAG